MPVRFTVAPDEVVPIARNWLVWPGEETDCDPGMMASETTLPVATPPPELATVRVALALTGPAKPAALAVIVVVPAPTAVANPPEVMVATVELLDVQVTEVVMFCVDA
jgi:hypothetical protein